MIDDITEIIKTTMDTNELDSRLQGENSDVVNVKYTVDNPARAINPIVTGQPPNGTQLGGTEIAVISASFLAFILIAALLLLKRSRRTVIRTTTEEEMFDEQILGITAKDTGSSLVVADSKDLVKNATCMDVHVCKSAICVKCYQGRNISFIPAPPNSNLRNITPKIAPDASMLSLSPDSAGTEDFWFGTQDG